MANTLKLGAGKWATSTDTVLAFNDENNNFKPLPFSFSRSSSATVVNQSGLIETVGSGTPRIDFQDNTKGALLLEPSRTNLIPYSQDIITGWSTIRVTVQNNQTISPDGVLNAALSTVTSDNGSHASFETLNGFVTAGNDYYISCFVKKSTTRYIRLNEGYVNDVVTFDLDTQSFSITQGSPTNVIFEDYGNGWYRIGYKFVAHSSGNTQFVLYINDNNNSTNYAGNGEAIYLWGVQIEAGSYATSYIKSNSGSATTRVADVCSQTVPDGVIGQTEGTVYVDFNINTGQGIGGIIELINPSNTQSRVLLWDATATNNNINLVAFFSAKSGSITLNNVSVGNHKAVLIYSNSFTKFFLDGVKIGEEVSNNPYSNMNKIDFNHTSGGVNFQQKTIKDVKLYNNALTDQEAIALTTI